MCNQPEELPGQSVSASERTTPSESALAPEAVSEPVESLPSALARYGIQLPAEQVVLLDRFALLLWDWNQKINLTRHTDYDKFVGRDIVDTLVFAEFLKPGEKVLDVGSGGGVPGTLLAIVRPDLRVWLSEPIGKKARVAEEIIQHLGLKVPVFRGRAEQILTKEQFNTLTIRAVARLRQLLSWFKPYWPQFDRMLVLKGPGWVQERGEARHYGLAHGLALRKLKTYTIPTTGAKSVLLQLCPEERLVGKKDCQLRRC
ncbi:MAG: 16S rRNA (guanine(527)-N(7))-methyltransferase RsmG [Thermoguttaceae bacterium]|nr:16S rRNA (guanine(527)-N(7))-methyltransferase RsmG [Thermoguttaceae bacterium]MDW8036778.1 16S rRNA (guanine(527)-N(7))-methyltransferase RsmG [Thermoguttaceae bacterium]